MAGSHRMDLTFVDGFGFDNTVSLRGSSIDPEIAIINNYYQGCILIKGDCITQGVTKSIIMIEREY